MDVEKRTTIVAGLNAEPMKQGLREIASEAQKTTATMTQSTAQMGRALLDASKGFDALAKKWVDGYRDALNYAQAYQTVQRALGEGRDKLGVIPSILENIEKNYGLVGTAARQAAATMADSTKTAEERLRALQALIVQMRAPAVQIARGPDLSGLDMLGDVSRRARAAADPGEQRAMAQQLASVQATVDQFAASSRSGWSQANKDAAESATAMGAALDALQAKFSPLIAAEKQHQEMLLEIAEAEKLGALSTNEATRAREAATASYRSAASAAHQQAQTLQSAHETANRGLLGISDPDPQASARRAADIEAYGKAMDRLRASVDPVYAASKRYEEELARIDQAEKLLLVTQERAAVLRQQATQQFAALNTPGQGNGLQQLAESGGQLQFAMRQLGVQAIQTFQGFATGQPVFMTLIQQGHQVADVMLAAGIGIRQLGSAIAAFAARVLASPITLPLIGVTAAIAAVVELGVHAENTARRIENMANQLRATRTDAEAAAQDIEAAARHLASTTSLGTPEARDIGQTIAPNFRGSQADLERMIKLGADLNAVFKGAGEGAKTLSEAMKEPAKVAKQLADAEFPGMSQALAEQVRLQELAGNKAGAFKEVLRVLEQQAAGVKDRGMTPLQKAVADLDKTLTAGSQNGRTYAETLGDRIAAAAAKAVSALDGLIRTFQRLDDAVGGPGARAIQESLRGGGGGTVAGKQLEGPVADEIRKAAAAKQLSELQTKFALAVAQQESGGLQIDPKTGKTLESSAGALGIMQLTPGTAEHLKVNPHDRAQNISGGLDYILELWQRYKGDPALVAMAYNWGPGNLDKWLAGSKSLTAVPAETQKYVKAVTGGDALGPTRAAEETRHANQEALDNAEKQRQALGLLQEKIRENQAQQAAQQKAIDIGGQAGDPEAVRKAQEALEHLKIASTDLITEQQKAARTYQEALIPLAAEAGAARELEQIRQKMAETARAERRPLDETAVAAAQVARLKELGVALDDNIKQTNRGPGRCREDQPRDRGAEAAGFHDERRRARTAARGQRREGPDRRAREVPPRHPGIHRVRRATDQGAERSHARAAKQPERRRSPQAPGAGRRPEGARRLDEGRRTRPGTGVQRRPGARRSSGQDAGGRRARAVHPPGNIQAQRSLDPEIQEPDRRRDLADRAPDQGHAGHAAGDRAGRLRGRARCQRRQGRRGRIPGDHARGASARGRAHD
jgi:soluble lytic murein transglycosylase-like protein